MFEHTTFGLHVLFVQVHTQSILGTSWFMKKIGMSRQDIHLSISSYLKLSNVRGEIIILNLYCESVMIVE